MEIDLSKCLDRMHVKSIQIKEEICRPVNVLALYTKTLEF